MNISIHADMLTIEQCLKENIAEQLQLSKRGEVCNRVSVI